MIVNGHALPTIEGIDDVCLVLRSTIAEKFGFEPRARNGLGRCQTKMSGASVRPGSRLLSELRWDGVRRLDTMLPVYFKAEDNPLNRAIGRKMMVAAVRRVMKPGCKFDYIVVMDTSEQGKKKSTAVEVLAGSDNFSDAGILDCDEKTDGIDSGRVDLRDRGVVGDGAGRREQGKDVCVKEGGSRETCVWAASN